MAHYCHTNPSKPQKSFRVNPILTLIWSCWHINTGTTTPRIRSKLSFTAGSSKHLRSQLKLGHNNENRKPQQILQLFTPKQYLLIFSNYSIHADPRNSEYPMIFLDTKKSVVECFWLLKIIRIRVFKQKPETKTHLRSCVAASNPLFRHTSSNN